MGGEGPQLVSPAGPLHLRWLSVGLPFHEFSQFHRFTMSLACFQHLSSCFKLFLKFKKPSPAVSPLKGGAELLMEVGQLRCNLDKVLVPRWKAALLPSPQWTVGQRQRRHCGRAQCWGRETRLGRATNVRALSCQGRGQLCARVGLRYRFWKGVITYPYKEIFYRFQANLVLGGTRGSSGIVLRSKPVPVKTSEEYWVKILWKAEALRGHQGLAELVWKLLLGGGTVGKLHIFHVYKILIN